MGSGDRDVKFSEEHTTINSKEYPNPNNAVDKGKYKKTWLYNSPNGSFSVCKVCRVLF